MLPIDRYNASHFIMIDDFITSKAISLRQDASKVRPVRDHQTYALHINSVPSVPLHCQKEPSGSESVQIQHSPLPHQHVGPHFLPEQRNSHPRVLFHEVRRLHGGDADHDHPDDGHRLLLGDDHLQQLDAPSSDRFPQSSRRS